MYHMPNVPHKCRRICIFSTDTAVVPHMQILFLYWLSSYNPRSFYENDAELKQALDQVNGGYFSPEDPNLFSELYQGLLNNDR